MTVAECGEDEPTQYMSYFFLRSQPAHIVHVIELLEISAVDFHIVSKSQLHFCPLELHSF